MVYAIAADAVLVVHLLFIGWVAFGGLAALAWPRLTWLHLPALTWGLVVSLTGRLCPLTPLEQWLRDNAGQQGYAGGFIDHYLVAVIYPQGLTRDHQLAIALALLILNTGIYGQLVVRRAGARRRRHKDAD
ncbi:DUF2784 domain-containing protein [Salinisphaera sp. T31B1]|uniref:DUF2784 domain-containing protein n=1 Tax=Salinisphaera sp. T31B1 TaxID=727963 RepID=UPI00333EC47D